MRPLGPKSELHMQLRAGIRFHGHKAASECAGDGSEPGLSSPITCRMRRGAGLHNYNGAGSASSSATIHICEILISVYTSPTPGRLQLRLQRPSAHGSAAAGPWAHLPNDYSKNLGDRPKLPVRRRFPGNALSRSTNGALLPQNRIDRSFTVISIPNHQQLQLPFGGKGQPGGDNAAVPWLAGGWLSEIYTYLAGNSPFAFVNGGSGAAGQGQAMPEITPRCRDAQRQAMGSNGYQYANLSNIKYMNSNAFVQPGDLDVIRRAVRSRQLPGVAPIRQLRRVPLLTGSRPGTQNLNAGPRCSFPLGRESRTFVFEANCFNVWNKVTFGGPSAAWSYNSSSFGNLTGVTGGGGGAQRRSAGTAVRRAHQLLTMKTSVPHPFPQSTRKGWSTHALLFRRLPPLQSSTRWPSPLRIWTVLKQIAQRRKLCRLFLLNSLR